MEILNCSASTQNSRGLEWHSVCCRRLKMEEFIPATFRMDVREERETFFAQQEGKIPTHRLYSAG